MISGWRGDRRIIGPPGPLADVSDAAMLALTLIGWSIALASAVVLIRLMFGDVPTLQSGLSTWAFTLLFVGELWVVFYLLLNRLWLSAAIAAPVIAALAFAVLHWAGPVLAAFGWSDAPIPVTS